MFVVVITTFDDSDYPIKNKAVGPFPTESDAEKWENAYHQEGRFGSFVCELKSAGLGLDPVPQETLAV